MRIILLITFMTLNTYGFDRYYFLGIGGMYSRTDIENQYGSKAQNVSDFEGVYSLSMISDFKKFELHLYHNEFKAGLNIDKSRFDYDINSITMSETGVDLFLRRGINIHFGVHQFNRSILKLYAAEITNRPEGALVGSLGAYVEGKGSAKSKFTFGARFANSISSHDEFDSFYQVRANLKMYFPLTENLIWGMDLSLSSENYSIDGFKQEIYYSTYQLFIGF